MAFGHWLLVLGSKMPIAVFVHWLVNRTQKQWLEMISRTRPTAFAVHALENELRRAELADVDLLEVQSALEDLRSQIAPETNLEALSERLQASLEYRPHGDANKGRLYLEIAGHEQIETLTHDGLDALEVYVFVDQHGFAGLQVDNAKTLPDRLAKALEFLRTNDFPHMDCVEAGLEHTSLADVLAWACEHRIEAGR